MLVGVVVFVDNVTKIVNFTGSSALMKDLGYTPADLLNISGEELMLNVIATEDRELVLERFSQAAEGCTPEQFCGEVAALCKDGTTKKLRVLSKYYRCADCVFVIFKVAEATAKEDLKRLVDEVVKECEWLGFNSSEEFELDAIRQKLEFLLSCRESER